MKIYEILKKWLNNLSLKLVVALFTNLDINLFSGHSDQASKNREKTKNASAIFPTLVHVQPVLLDK